MTSSVKTYEFTAFSEADLVDGHIGKGVSFKMPAAATLCFEAKDNDSSLSGDRNDHARDGSYQTAHIDRDGHEVGNGGQIYADKYFWVKDSHGNTYKLIEIGQEGSHEKYYTFDKDYGIPADGAHLQITSSKNSGSVKYKDLHAGDKPEENEPPEFTNIPDDCIVCVDENGKHVIDLEAIDPDGHKVSGDGDDDDDDDGWSKNSAGDGDDDDDDDGKSGDGDDDDDDDGKSGDGDDDDDNDDDGGSDHGLTFKITGGADKDLFKIDPETGKLVFKEAPDFENPEDHGADNVYEVEVGVMDKDGATTTKLLKVQVKDVDEPDPECIIIEAEDMHDWGFRVEHGDKASGGEFQMLKCAGGNGDLWTYFEGESGCYDLSLFVQDESDGQSEITVKINGKVVDVVKLDRDSDGKGDNDGHFSEFTLKHIDIEQGDKITFWVDGDKCEFVRFDKIVLKEAKGSISGTVFCDDDCDGIQDPDTCELGPDLIVNGDFEHNSLNNKGVVFNAQNSDLPGWFFVGSRTADLLEENAEGHGNATGEAIVELDAGAILCQEVDIPEDCIYLLTLDVLENPHISASDNRFKIFINGEEVEVVAVEGQQTLTFELDLKAGDTRIDFKSLSHKGDGPALAKVQLQKKTVVPGEAGKEGVTVTLLDADGNPVLDDDGNPITTVTDADGNYTFEDVAEGDYRVKFDAPDGTVFTEQNVGSDDTIDSDVNADGVSDLIKVGKCEKVKDVDAGVKDPPEGSISGRYFCDEDCDGIEDAGEPPIVGVTVRLLDGSGAEIATTVTDANGEYEFTGLEAGDYQVVFDPDPSGKVFTLQDQGNNDTVDSDVDDTGATGTITLGKGEKVTDVDAGVKEPPVETASLAGRYFCDENRNDVDDSEPGIAGVTVVLTDAAGNFVAETQTDANGDYLFTDLDPGSYKVQFPGLPPKAGDDSLATKTDSALTFSIDNDLLINDIDEDGGTFTFDSFTQPANGVLTDNGNGTLTYTPDAGFTGVDTFTYDIDDGDPQTPVSTATVSIEVADQIAIQSDDFASGGLQSFWEFEGGAGTSAEVQVEDGEAFLAINLPSGDFDPNPFDGSNDGVRVRQKACDGDFQVEAKFLSVPTEQFEMQGIMVEQDADNWLRFDIRAQGAGNRLFVGHATTDGGGTTELDITIDPAEAAVMRVTRVGDTWTFETSADGVQFVPRVTFDLAITANTVGPFGGTRQELDGYTVKVDYFNNSALPVEFDDASLDARPPTKEFVAKDVGDDDTIDSDVDPTNGMTDVIVLEAGDNVTDVDAGVQGPPLGAIGDTVWIDSFGNGLLDEFEARLGGVNVQLLDGDGNVIAETTTALDGTYLFQNLEAGDYQVQFNLPEPFEFTAQDAGDDTLDSDADPVTGRTGIITLDEGEVDLTNDAGVLRAGLIEGTSQSDPNSPVDGNDLLIGSSQNDQIFGFSGEDILIGNEGNDTLFGQNDADILEGGAGDDILDGGQFSTPDFGSENRDVAVYQGASTDYLFSVDAGTGDLLVTDNNLGDGLDEGTDRLVEIEFLRFSDGEFAIDTFLV